MLSRSEKRRAVGLYEARAKFGELVRQAKSGREIVITERGMPVAVLGPVLPSESERERRKREGDESVAWFKVRQNRTRVGIPLRELIDEGRRY